MGQDTLAMTRRRLLGAVTTVGVAGAGAGAGTTALFSDSDSSSGNSLQAGTIDLTLDGQDATVTLLSELNVAPGDSGQATMQVANTGSLPGYLDIEVVDAIPYENDCVPGESSADSTCGDPGPYEGELQDHLELHAEFQNGPELWSGWKVAANVNAVHDLDYKLDGGASDTFVLDWRLPADAGDEAQSDSLEFTLRFSLDQQPDSGA